MMKILLPLILFNLNLYAADKYSSYKELIQNEIEGQDYTIEVTDKKHPISILAVHGGMIETGTSELTQLIAGNEFNQYHFKGKNFSLHITSSKFDEPKALELAKKSQNCLSIHGFINDAKEAICIGGGDSENASLLAKELQNQFPSIEIEFPCKKYPGKDPSNIVNRCQNTGIQLEMSGKLRRRLLNDSKAMNQLSEVIRSFLIKNI